MKKLTFHEMVMMSIITGFTNFALVPGLVIPWKLG